MKGKGGGVQRDRQREEESFIPQNWSEEKRKYNDII